ncbi:conserved hypothetical protein, partial [Ricinus communis]
MPARLARIRSRVAIRLSLSPAATGTATHRLPPAISAATCAARAGSPPRRRNRARAHSVPAPMLKTSVARHSAVSTWLLRSADASTRDTRARAGRIVAVEEGGGGQCGQRGAGEGREQGVCVAAAVEVHVQLDVAAGLLRLEVAEAEWIAVEVVRHEHAQVQPVAVGRGKVRDGDGAACLPDDRDERVGARAAADGHRCAVLAQEIKRVVTIAAARHRRAGACAAVREDGVGTGAAVERVAGTAADDVVARTAVDAVVAGRKRGNGIVARATLECVVAGFVAEVIVAVATGQRVVAFMAVEVIVAVAAVEQVVAAAAIQEIAAVQAADRVVGLQAAQLVGFARSRQRHAFRRAERIESADEVAAAELVRLDAVQVQHGLVDDGAVIQLDLGLQRRTGGVRLQPDGAARERIAAEVAAGAHLEIGNVDPRRAVRQGAQRLELVGVRAGATGQHEVAGRVVVHPVREGVVAGAAAGARCGALDRFHFDDEAVVAVAAAVVGGVVTDQQVVAGAAIQRAGAAVRAAIVQAVGHGQPVVA